MLNVSRLLSPFKAKDNLQDNQFLISGLNSRCQITQVLFEMFQSSPTDNKLDPTSSII